MKPKSARDYVPEPVKACLRPGIRAARRIVDWCGDAAESWRNRNSMIPPRSMIFIGAGDFIQIGREFREYFIQLGGLMPHHHVLDVGSGIGRMAIPLTEYLTQGEYWGIDIVKEGVDWCANRISPRFPHFHFELADVYNKYYNPSGSQQPEVYRFPYPNGQFDFVFLTSVFTHMQPASVERYLSEIARVLKPTGVCFATFFLLNEESNRLQREGASIVDFKYRYPIWATTDENQPDIAVAYEEPEALAIVRRSGLKLLSPPKYGAWCGRQDGMTFQDVILCGGPLANLPATATSFKQAANEVRRNVA